MDLEINIGDYVETKNGKIGSVIYSNKFCSHYNLHVLLFTDDDDSNSDNVIFFNRTITEVCDYFTRIEDYDFTKTKKNKIEKLICSVEEVRTGANTLIYSVEKAPTNKEICDKLNEIINFFKWGTILWTKINMKYINVEVKD